MFNLTKASALACLIGTINLIGSKLSRRAPVSRKDQIQNVRVAQSIQIPSNRVKFNKVL